ncbi:MAG: response regulator [Desulfobacterales bacterium]|nr:response regulator [Desulfobacterales bacterium]
MTTQKRILVVDDEPDLTLAIRKRLEKEGFLTDVAYDGSEAMAKVEANPPDAIVLDVMMPEMDGYAVCSKLKNDSRYEEIPILMLTAVADHVGSTKYSHYGGKAMDADDYIPKGPESTEEIIAGVKRLLE